MKNAPNVKKLPDDAFTEAVIFAGEDAWIHAKNWQDGNPAKDTTPPIVLDSKQLSALNNLRIIDDGRRFARVYRAGKLTELQTSIIATKLAVAGVTSACFYSESYELLEDWSERLPGLREDAISGDSVSLQLQAIEGGKITARNEGSLSELGDGEALTPEELNALKAINRTYTHVTIGGKHKVVSLKPCQVNGETHAFEDLAQFRNYFYHIPKIAKRSAGSAWLSWPGKNYKPGGVGFYPNITRCPPDVFNLFSGLSVAPVNGDCSPYTGHLRDVICAGDETAYQYLMGWMAHLIQKPDEKPSVAIVMKSVPGTGKGTTVSPLLEILGQYATHINGAGQIAGRFNSTLANKLLVFADEVTVRNRAEADRLKGIISESSVNLERKGIDAEPMPNFARLIFASNSTQALIAGIGERRYLVLEPDPTKAQEKGYFDHLHAWVNDNGAGKLLYLLQHYDLTPFDRHRAPQTSALREEILQGLSGVNLFLYTEIMKDRPFDGVARIAVSGLIDKFISWSQEQGDVRQAAAARTLVGKAMVGMKLKSFGRRGRGDGVIYELPDGEALREAFAHLIGMGGYDVF